MKQYSLLNESKKTYVDFCTEEDCEMIPFIKTANDIIKNSPNEDDITNEIRKTINHIRNNWTRTEEFKKISPLKQKFLLDIIDTFKDHISHLMIIDVWCGLIDKERWIKCFEPTYVKHSVNCIKRGSII